MLHVVGCTCAGQCLAALQSRNTCLTVPVSVSSQIDEAAEFCAASKWGQLDFPPPFGRLPWPEEAYIHDLDSRTGS